MTERPVPVLDATEPAEQGFDLREALGFVWRQWKFVVAVTGLVCAVGFVLLLQETPLYTANAQILLNQQQTAPPGGDAVMPQAALDLSMIESQMAIIRSTAFLRRVVERNHLASDPVIAAHSPDPTKASPSLLSEVSSFLFSLLPSGVSFAASSRSENPPTVPPVADDPIPPGELSAVKSLSSGLKVVREGTGDVVTISFTSPDPVRAAHLANFISDAYLVDKLDTRFEAAKRASSWLGDRLVTLQNQLHDSEEAVEQFKAQHGLTDAGKGITLSQQQLADLNSNLVSAKADLAQKKSQLDLLNSLIAKGGTLEDMPSIANSGALPSLRAQASALSVQEAQLLTHYDKNHPLVINIDAQLRDINRSIAAETDRLVAGVRNDNALAQARASSLDASFRQATGQTNIDDATAIRLHELERTADVNKALFEDFLKQAKITEAQSNFEPQDVRIITPALAPTRPSSPQEARFMSVTLFIGLLSGMGGAFAKEKLRAGFTTPKEVEDQLHLPVLASVTRLMPRDLKSDDGTIKIHEIPTVRPLGRYSEAIRSLRSGVHMTDVDHPPKVIQITSAAPGEGKTTVALALAASAAMANLKILFIDADLRHPSASRTFGLHTARGLVDVLVGDATLTDTISYYETGKYWVLPAGSKTKNPTDLLGSERMKNLVAGFKQTCDLVIIDSPPSGPVMDPVVIAQLCDKIVFVIRWGATARELVKQSVELLSGHRKIAGVALNRVNEHEAQKYGKYGYSYYYGTRYYKNYYHE